VLKSELQEEREGRTLRAEPIDVQNGNFGGMDTFRYTKPAMTLDWFEGEEFQIILHQY